MSSQAYCDWEPCRLLQKFIRELATTPRSPATVQALVFAPKTDMGKVPLRLLTFYYCPFCGTRLDKNEEILRWIETNGVKH
jgi:hypothetical protein